MNVDNIRSKIRLLGIIIKAYVGRSYHFRNTNIQFQKQAQKTTCAK